MKCPECKSTHVKNVIDYTANKQTGWACRRCRHTWKTPSLKRKRK